MTTASKGHDNTTASKGNNYNWQFNMLKLLNSIYKKMGGTDTNNGAALVRTTTTVSYAANTLIAISIANMGAITGTVNGIALKANEEISYSSNPGSLIETAFAIDANGSDFLITTMTP